MEIIKFKNYYFIITYDYLQVYLTNGSGRFPIYAFSKKNVLSALKETENEIIKDVENNFFLIKRKEKYIQIGCIRIGKKNQEKILKEFGKA